MPEAKYIYCVVPECEEFKPFSVKGVDRVYTICYNGMGCVVSDTDEEEYSLADQTHLRCHEMVLENVMRRYEMLPVQFGTVAPNKKAVLQFLTNNRADFKRLFKKLRGKVEIEIEVFWKDMRLIFDQIARDSKCLSALKVSADPKSRDDLIMAGQLVSARLKQKKEAEAARIVKYLKGTYVDYQHNPHARDELVLYGSFLVDTKELTAFNQKIDQFEAENRRHFRVRYIGPMPPYSFASARL